MKRKRRRRGRRRGQGRFVITAVILLILVVVFAWTLKHKKEEEELQFPVESETKTEERVPLDEVPQEVLMEEPQEILPEEPQEILQETPETAVSLEEQIAAHRAGFVTDYTSKPLLEGTSVKYLTIQQGKDPGELRFNWFSPSKAKSLVVLYNTVTGESTTVTAQTAASATEAGWYYHKAVVTDLSEDSKYTYKVGNDGGWSPEYSFETRKFTGDYTFMVTSDAQIGQSEMEVMQETAHRWDRVVTRIRDYVPESAFLVHLGDQVAGFNDVDQYRLFFEHLALYEMPLVPVVGNHDVDNWGRGGGPWFYERYNVPNRTSLGCNWGDTDGDYWFRYGNTLFMVLNSDTVYEPDIHETFVEQACAANPDVTWRIILVHKSVYSSVEKYQFDAERYRESFAYMGELYDIDLFLSGHDHAYTRSAVMSVFCEPLTEYEYASGSVLENPQGPVYVTCSTASGCIYQTQMENYAAVAQRQLDVPMAIRVDVTDHTLKLTAYEADSWQVFDEITLQK